jgi:hypothetical protein
MPIITRLDFGTGIDTRGWKAGIEEGRRSIESLYREAEKRAERLTLGTPDFKAGSSGPASDAGQQIQDGLASAAGPISAFLNRFSTDFNRVGATVIELAKRIDGEMKFPKTQAGFDMLRDVVRTRMVDASGEVTRFGQILDSTLGQAKAVHKFADAFASMGSVVRTSIGGVRPERLSFAGPVKSLGGLSVAARQASSSFKSLGVQVAAALGAFGLIYKGVEFLKDGVKGAANLGETVSKTDAILGGASAGVKRFADEAASKFGLVRQETLDTAASLGGLGKGLGQLGGRELEDFTKKYTMLAADLQSFANTSTLREAGQALAIGLSGEQSDTLKRLGVVLNEDTTKAYAFANGIAKYGEELSNQQKVMARAGLISRALADANGDLERTAGSAANQWRKFTGNLENLATSIGGQLLPYLTAGVTGLNEFAAGMGAADQGAFSLKDTLDGIVDGIATVVGAAQSIGVGFKFAQAGITEFAGVVIQSIGSVNNAIAKLIPGGSLVRDAITGDLEAIGADMRRQADLMGADALKLEQKLGDLGAKVRAKFAGVKPGTSGATGSGAMAMGEDSAALKLGKSVEDLNKKLREQFNTFGMTSRAADVYKLALSGASKAELAEATSLARRLDAMDAAKEKFDDLKNFAEGLSESIRTPFEKFREEAAKIQDAFAAGLITKDQQSAGLSKAFGEMGKDSNQGSSFSASAVEVGSKEAFSAILKAASGTSSPQQRIEQAAREQIQLQKEANRISGEVVAALKASPQIQRNI